ncbi:hypothetical protein I3842_01G084000 [Carya illinoinensis]|uniref:DUF4283 domain-containing protein n=1 Tax=Carya illinoinensis TaxID=32201 RepID=A0A922FY50_CARIL|nr:hypothetical protein I3842_01G084000 [Carya illinoinensis]
MAEELSRRWESLKLTEIEQDEITISKEIVFGASTKGEHCLLAMVFNDRAANREAFKSTMAKIWNLEGWLTFMEIGLNKFLMEFQLTSDKVKVVRGRPWSFDRHLICLNEFNGALSPLEV